MHGTDVVDILLELASRKLKRAALVVMAGMLVVCPAAVKWPVKWYITEKGQMLTREIERILPSPSSLPEPISLTPQARHCHP